MKKIAKILLGLIFLLQIAVAGTYTSIYDALPEAQNENKLIAFFILSSNCPHCIKFMQDVNNNKNLLNFLQNKYVVVYTDIARGGKVPVDLPFQGETPTFMIVTPSGRVVMQPIEGIIPSAMLYDFVKKVQLLKEKYDESSGL
ncbi:hypothetical protein [Nitrosophilus labii]|uniref:hypothetical protein n=1 Tax=Nitrosophilus labii TaxID=2706014 RepID=UPI0016568EE9|nr:hypothetical protein [Nitrosophilus labii]